MAAVFGAADRKTPVGSSPTSASKDSSASGGKSVLKTVPVVNSPEGSTPLLSAISVSALGRS